MSRGSSPANSKKSENFDFSKRLNSEPGHFEKHFDEIKEAEIEDESQTS